ncbi:MAG: ribonuclease P protein component [Calditrichaeota bacterium]|nr:MAG: ribonuclease P protein component [Calditrichota bacterium]
MQDKLFSKEEEQGAEKDFQSQVQLIDKKFGLAKKSSMRLPINFSQVFRQGSKVKGRFADAFFVSNDSFRIGFTVRKKIRSKPIRNYGKRILRETFRTNPELIEDFGNVHIVFILKQIPKEEVLQALATDLKFFAEKLKKLSIKSDS